MGERIGVILMNLGGPSSPEEIRPFLVRLFSDREIIRLPGGPLLQPLMARLIARLRLKRVRRNYEAIGGRSPLLRLTRLQAEGLREVLATRGFDARVGVAMRYTSPSSAQTLMEMTRSGVSRLVALTLYPQYSKATTGSSLTALRRAMEWAGAETPFAVVDRFPEHPVYLDSVAERVWAGLKRWPAEQRADVVLLFSAHSLPQRLVDEGDPYVVEVKRTIEGVLARLPHGQPWRLGFQSRAGPVQWVGPDTSDVIRRLGQENVRGALCVPVAFVSDHIETLQEIDLLYAGEAREAGIETFRRSESLNDSPTFLEALADLVEEALS
ncbi:MAG: ferrochelatase [Planctomycetota bacterium]|jgi:ferrochelatase